MSENRYFTCERNIHSHTLQFKHIIYFIINLYALLVFVQILNVIYIFFVKTSNGKRNKEMKMAEIKKCLFTIVIFFLLLYL